MRCRRGKIIKEAKVASDPCVLATFFKGLGFPVTRIGFEAGPCRIGCTRVLGKPDSTWCFWRPATSRQRCQRWWSRPTAKMRVGLRSSYAWAGTRAVHVKYSQTGKQNSTKKASPGNSRVRRWRVIIPFRDQRGAAAQGPSGAVVRRDRRIFVP